MCDRIFGQAPATIRRQCLVVVFRMELSRTFRPFRRHSMHMALVHFDVNVAFRRVVDLYTAGTGIAQPIVRYIDVALFERTVALHVITMQIKTIIVDVIVHGHVIF